MAPKRKADKYPVGKAKKKKVKNSDEHDDGPQPDPTQDPARSDTPGVVLANGKFRCGLSKPGHPNTLCHTQVKNHPRHIVSHINKIHDPHSKYAEKQDSSKTQKCKVCGKKLKNLNTLSNHQRDFHPEGDKVSKNDDQPTDAIVGEMEPNREALKEEKQAYSQPQPHLTQQIPSQQQIGYQQQGVSPNLQQDYQQHTFVPMDQNHKSYPQHPVYPPPQTSFDQNPPLRNQPYTEEQQQGQRQYDQQDTHSYQYTVSQFQPSLQQPTFSQQHIDPRLRSSGRQEIPTLQQVDTRQLAHYQQQVHRPQADVGQGYIGEGLDAFFYTEVEEGGPEYYGNVD